MAIQVPHIEGSFSPIYLPQPDFFDGPNSAHLRAGELYEEWIPNDHTVVRGTDGSWHLFGITGPSTPIVHEAEWMSFHAVLGETPLRDSLSGILFEEHAKLLYPSERPGERYNLWAPFCAQCDGIYYLFYGPHEMRLATSTNLVHWTPVGTLFAQDGCARDPYVFHADGIHYMAYVAGNTVFLRASSTMLEWGEPTEIFRMPFAGSPESPSIVTWDDAFYLFWCIYDGLSDYDTRTFVYRSDTFHDFNGRAPIAMLRAHAPEIICDDGEWFITSAEWPVRGVSLAQLVWE